MSLGNTTQYGGDVVMFQPNKKIKNKKFYYLGKNFGKKNNTIWGRCCNVPTYKNNKKYNSCTWF